MPLHDISSATSKSLCGFYVGRGGLYSPPPPSPDISPGDAKKSCAASAWGKAANTYGHCRRPTSPRRRRSLHAASARGAAACILGHRHRLERCPATPRSPAQLLRRARQPTPMAVAVYRHLLGDDEVPARFLLKCGGLHSRPSPSPGISTGDAKKSRAASARGEAANTYGGRHRQAYPQR